MDDVFYCGACKGVCGRQYMACAALAFGVSESDLWAIYNGLPAKSSKKSKTIYSLFDDNTELALVLAQLAQLWEHNIVLTTKEEVYHIMPRKKGTTNDTSKTPQNPAMQWKGIIDVKITQVEKDAFKLWVRDADVAGHIEDVLTSGYGIKITYKFDEGTFLASLSCYQTSDPNYAHTMISRAKTAYDAMALSMYKHLYVAERDWGAVDNDGDGLA